MSKEKVWRGAERFSFCPLFLFSKEKVGCLRFSKPPKEHREAENFSFCPLFLFSKEKVGCLRFSKPPKEHREAENFSFCLLFLFSKEIGMARSGELFFLHTFSFE
ncbi:MAG: hypothetical protein ACLVD4_02335 [Negativibacillus sp.]